MYEEVIESALREYERRLKLLETAKNKESVIHFLTFSCEKIYLHMLMDGNPDYKYWLKKTIDYLWKWTPYKEGRLETNSFFSGILFAALILEDEEEINKCLAEFPRLAKEKNVITHTLYFQMGVLMNDIALAEEYLPEINRYSTYDSYTRNLNKNIIEVGRAILDRDEEELEKQLAVMEGVWKRSRSKKRHPICTDAIVYRNLFKYHMKH